MKRRSLRP